MNKVIMCSIIACVIINNSMGMFRFARVIKNTNTRKRWYHNNPEDKYEKIAKNILNGTLDRKRKDVLIMKPHYHEPSSDIPNKQTDSHSENTLQTQSLQFLYNQQLLSLALNSSNTYDPYSSSISNSISNSDSSHNGSNPDV